MKSIKSILDNLLVQFSITSFLILAVTAVAFGVVLTEKYRSHAIDVLAGEAVGDFSGQILRVITPADLEAPMTGERYDRFDDFVQRSIVSASTAWVKLWAKDGTVV